MKRQKTITPVDGSVYVERELASNPAIERALFMAAKAQKAWKQVPVAERAAICRRMADWCVARADELATELSWQMGRPVSQTPGELRRGFHERALYMCDDRGGSPRGYFSAEKKTASSASSAASRSAWCWSWRRGTIPGSPR